MTSHSETKYLPYTAKEMFDLVADISSYPEFLPWCAAARIREEVQKGQEQVQELVRVQIPVRRRVRRQHDPRLWPVVVRVERAGPKILQERGADEHVQEDLRSLRLSRQDVCGGGDCVGSEVHQPKLQKVVGSEYSFFGIYTGDAALPATGILYLNLQLLPVLYPPCPNL